jgi:hypothetical protein
VLVTVGAYSALPTERAEATTKWFPGHYLRVHHDKPFTNAESFLRLANTTGVKYEVNWDALEGNKGQYNFSEIDRILTLAQRYGKRVVLNVKDRDFGGNVTGNMPAYLQATCVYPMDARGDAPGSKGGALRWWDPVCVDHIIDLYEAIGARYDCNTTLAGIVVGGGESALAGREDEPGYTHQRYVDQYIRALRETKQAFPNTLTLIGFNYMADDGLQQVARAVDALGGSGFVHPDTAPGIRFGDATDIEISYRGRVPTFANFELAQTEESMSNLEIVRWAGNTIGASFYGWNHYRPNYTTYIADVLAFMATTEARTLAQQNASCPSRIAPCVTTLSSCSSTYTPPPTPSTCTNTLTSTASIPTGYGASYNPLTSAREYLVQASCTGTTQATVTAGNGNPLTYVYNRGYYYSGTAWTPYTLTCASGALIGGAWCPGRATASIPLPQNPTNVIAYTCQYTNSTWKCGCRDATCSTAYWQLQRIQR